MQSVSKYFAKHLCKFKGKMLTEDPPSPSSKYPSQQDGFISFGCLPTNVYILPLSYLLSLPHDVDAKINTDYYYDKVRQQVKERRYEYGCVQRKLLYSSSLVYLLSAGQLCAISFVGVVTASTGLLLLCYTWPVNEAKSLERRPLVRTH